MFNYTLRPAKLALDNLDRVRSRPASLPEILDCRKGRPAFRITHGISTTLTLTTLLVLTSACSTGKTKAEKEDATAARNQVSELRGMVSSLTSRLEAVEGRLNTMNDRVGTTNSAATPAAKLEGVGGHPADGVGVTPLAGASAKDPDGAFVNDEAVRDFRNSMTRFRAGQYAEAAINFSSFLEKYPDHPLAGSAQYYIGRSHFNQRDFALALQEYNRVLTTYDRSTHIVATLRDMAEAEQILKRPDDSTRHHQLVTSLFPHSPEANRRNQASESTAPASASETAPAAGKEDASITGNGGPDAPPPTAPAVSTAASLQNSSTVAPPNAVRPPEQKPAETSSLDGVPPANGAAAEKFPAKTSTSPGTDNPHKE